MKKRERTADSSVIAMQAGVMINLGLAVRAQQEGAPLRAVVHLTRAVESITALIEAWTAEEVESDERAADSADS